MGDRFASAGPSMEEGAKVVSLAPRSARDGSPNPRWSRVNRDQLAIARLSQQLVQSETLGELDDGDDGDSFREASIDEEDEEPEAEQPEEQAVQSGFLTKRAGALKTKQRRYCVIDAGTLSWYKSDTNLTSPVGYVTLADSTIAPPPAGSCAFAVVVDGKSIDFQADTAAACLEWVAALQKHASMQPAAGFNMNMSSSFNASSSDPQASKGKAAKKEKSGKGMVADLRLRAQKRVASKAITSDLGKKLLKEFCAPPTRPARTPAALLQPGRSAAFSPSSPLSRAQVRPRRSCSWRRCRTSRPSRRTRR